MMYSQIKNSSTMIKTFLTFTLAFLLCISFAQDDQVKTLQGIWEVEGDVESYMVFNNRVNYSIIVLNHKTIIRKRFFGFLENTSGDTLDIRELEEKGEYFFLFTGNYVKGQFLYHRYQDFDEYTYDLDEDYFVYYANDPVMLNRIEALPSRIQKIFDERKEELSKIKFLED